MVDEEMGMPAKRELSMRQLRHLLRLHHGGVSAREIGRRLGVARSTVQDNLKRAAAAALAWPLADDVTEDALGLRLFGRAGNETGYSRDKRSDCVQVVIAPIVTPDGLPLAHEVMDGNTSDKTTLKAFLAKIEKQYGAAKRTWVMDRGIPTEEVLAEMRASPTPIHYLVGTPRGRLTKLEKALAAKSWENVRESVRVKLIEDGEETYVLARSEARRDKEQGMRRRRLRKLIKRLGAVSTGCSPLSNPIFPWFMIADQWFDGVFARKM
jgi:hypothetical protein